MAKGSTLNEVFKGVTFFLPAYLICIVLLMVFPWLITFLPGLL
jgi:TRAP-type C4-dicarboxylate transport system permease large subunit